MKEIFKDIPSYEGLYQVSTLGRVKSLSRFESQTERILLKYRDKSGYDRVVLSYKNVQKKCGVHRLMALSFINNPENKPQINHIDGNKANNIIQNLEWCTQSENMKHAFRIGLQSLVGEKNTRSKLTELDVFNIRKLLSENVWHKHIAAQFNVSRRCITDINVGNTWTHI